jgi:hypothetical protein
VVPPVIEENSGGQTVGLHAASEGLKGAAKSPSFLYALRAKTGVPMTLGGKVLGRMANVLLITDALIGYHKEAREILGCQDGN